MKNHHKIELAVFKSYWFVVALIFLLLNDFYLKSAFGNAITGKISDVFGLFVFSLFFLALF